MFSCKTVVAARLTAFVPIARTCASELSITIGTTLLRKYVVEMTKTPTNIKIAVVTRSAFGLNIFLSFAIFSLYEKIYSLITGKGSCTFLPKKSAFQAVFCVFRLYLLTKEAQIAILI